MVAWCVDRLRESGVIWDEQKIHHLFQLQNGCRAVLTAKQ
jgi:hypothetical protein